MKQITTDFLLENRGCYSPNEVVNLLDEIHDSTNAPVTGIINLVDIVKSSIPLKDKYWFICKKIATREQNQQIAIAVAEIVLPIYEKRCPGDSRVRECIAAAKAFLKGEIELDGLVTKRRAAYAAAAYAAAAYAAAAYAAAGIKAQLLDYLIKFVESL